MRIRSILVGFGEIRFNADRFVTVGERFIELVQFEVCLTALVIGLSVVWLEPNRFGVIRNGFVILLRVCFAAGLVKEVGDVGTGWGLPGNLPGCLSSTSWLWTGPRARGLRGSLDDRDGRGGSYCRRRSVPTGEHDS